jgi:hypothetical protein
MLGVQGPDHCFSSHRLLAATACCRIACLFLPLSGLPAHLLHHLWPPCVIRTSMNTVEGQLRALLQDMPTERRHRIARAAEFYATALLTQPLLRHSSLIESVGRAPLRYGALSRTQTRQRRPSCYFLSHLWIWGSCCSTTCAVGGPLAQDRTKAGGHFAGKRSPGYYGSLFVFVISKKVYRGAPLSRRAQPQSPAPPRRSTMPLPTRCGPWLWPPLESHVGPCLCLLT